MERLEAKQIKGHTYSLGFHTRALRRSQDSGNSVVNSVCRDSADGLCQFGVRLRSARRPSRKAARGVCSLTRGNQPARSADRASLAKRQIRRDWRKLDDSPRRQVHPGLTEQHAVRAQRSSKKRQTKPIEISHKSLALRELVSDRFGLLYAKQTEFRVVEAATLEDWRCRLVARKWVARLSRFPDISRQFTAHLFRPWIPNSKRCQHFLSSLGPFLAA